jgi:hypothetical protein
MANDLVRTQAYISLLRDCSTMDDSVVERLRATVEVSMEWAEQTLDVLIRLDDELKAFDGEVKQQLHSLCLPESQAGGGSGDRIPRLEEVAHQAGQSVDRLRNGVREVMMSMQNQDVIGQALERAASALEKRAAAIERVGEVLENSPLQTDEIAEIHRVYRTEDDLHRAAGSDGAEYKAAA